MKIVCTPRSTLQDPVAASLPAPQSLGGAFLTRTTAASLALCAIEQPHLAKKSPFARAGPYLGATRKFIDFVKEFLPDPPPVRPAPWGQFSWEPQEMQRIMKLIYGYRSQALHGGKPFPAPMCIPPVKGRNSPAPSKIPPGTAMSYLGGTWLREDTPICLHTFEYIVRGTLLNWWSSLASVNSGNA
jgi:hypothetical protein